MGLNDPRRVKRQPGGSACAGPGAAGTIAGEHYLTGGSCMAALKDAQQPDGLITALLEHANVMMRRILCRKSTDTVIGRAAADACGRLQFSLVNV